MNALARIMIPVALAGLLGRPTEPYDGLVFGNGRCQRIGQCVISIQAAQIQA